MSRRIKVTLQSVLALLGIIGMAIIAWVIPILSQIAVAASMAFGIIRRMTNDGRGVYKLIKKLGEV